MIFFLSPQNTLLFRAYFARPTPPFIAARTFLCITIPIPGSPTTLSRDLCSSHLHAALPFLHSTAPALSPFLTGVFPTLASMPLFSATPINHTQEPVPAQSSVRRSRSNPSGTTMQISSGFKGMHIVINYHSSQFL